MKINYDCRHFKGYMPCTVHKETGHHCEECPLYDPISQRILIIKLAAMGDVIRTTPLLYRLKAQYPDAAIYWITRTPTVLPRSVDYIMDWNLDNILILEETEFDLVINLDKDYEACALAKRVQSKEKCGFILKQGVPAPVNQLAEHKFLTGLFDDISQQNKKSYQEEIFEICGWKFEHEPYWVAIPDSDKKWDLPRDQKIIGLNTGCGGRWTSRLWPENYWIELVRLLQTKGYYPLLLGGPEERERNARIQNRTGCDYKGVMPLKDFFQLINQCHLVVTAVTMAMHLAIALRKKLVLFNNIFNRHEFELYGLGRILEPKHCTCYYTPVCDKGCMREITPAMVLNTIEELLDT